MWAQNIRASTDRGINGAEHLLASFAQRLEKDPRRTDIQSLTHALTHAPHLTSSTGKQATSPAPPAPTSPAMWLPSVPTTPPSSAMVLPSVPSLPSSPAALSPTAVSAAGRQGPDSVLGFGPTDQAMGLHAARGLAAGVGLSASAASSVAGSIAGSADQRAETLPEWSTMTLAERKAQLEVDERNDKAEEAARKRAVKKEERAADHRQRKRRPSNNGTHPKAKRSHGSKARMPISRKWPP